MAAVHVTAVLTHQCNLACAYCYAGPKSSRAMDDRVAGRSVAMVFSDEEEACLSFFGGEPMLEFPRMLAMARAARRLGARKGREVRFSLTTNATVLEERHLRFLAQYRFRVAVSLDGLGEDQDRGRPFRSGRGSSERVWTNVVRALPYLPGLRVLMVVQPSNAAGIPRAVDALRRLGVRRISLLPDMEAPWQGEALDGLRRLYYRMAREAVRDPDLSLDPFEGRLDPSRHRPHCRFGVGEVSVSPAGHLYPCSRLVGADTREDLRIGSVETGVSLERAEAMVRESRARMAEAGAEGPCACVPFMPGRPGQAATYRLLRDLADEAARAARQFYAAAEA